MENREIRELAFKNGIKWIEIARKIGISREYLSRMISKPLSRNNRQKILNAISIICAEKGIDISDEAYNTDQTMQMIHEIKLATQCLRQAENHILNIYQMKKNPSANGSF